MYSVFLRPLPLYKSTRAGLGFNLLHQIFGAQDTWDVLQSTPEYHLGETALASLNAMVTNRLLKMKDMSGMVGIPTTRRRHNVTTSTCSIN